MMALDNGDQYTQLCNDGRQIANRLWIIPATAYPISFYGLKVAHDATDAPVVRLVVSVLVVAVFFGFLFHFARYMAYGDKIARQIKKLDNAVSGGARDVIHLFGLKAVKPDGIEAGALDNRWYVRLARRSSAGGVMFHVMFLSWLVYVGIAITYIIQWSKVTKPS